jgi:hypothetical protein
MIIITTLQVFPAHVEKNLFIVHLALRDIRDAEEPPSADMLGAPKVLLQRPMRVPQLSHTCGRGKCCGCLHSRLSTEHFGLADVPYQHQPLGSAVRIASATEPFPEAPQASDLLFPGNIFSISDGMLLGGGTQL